MKSTINVKFNNNYHVELIDATTQEIKQQGDFHNVATAGLLDLFTIVDARQNNMMYNLMVGSGRTTPQSTDTALTSPLWNINAGTLEHEWVDDYTLRATGTYTFPASSQYVGNVTEVGLRARVYSSSYLAPKLSTHALLTDSEGQLISFNKTDTDILIFKITVEMSLNSSTESFKFFKKCNFLKVMLGLRNLSITSQVAYGVYGSLDLMRFNFDLNTAPSDSATNPVERVDLVVNRLVTESYTRGTDFISFNNSRVLSTNITEETYYKAVAITGLGYWELPNENVFPTYNINGLSIGTGDGTKSVFQNPINYFKEGTEKVYKNGVQLARNVDYTINNIGNKDCLPELSQGNLKVAKVSSSVDVSRYTMAAYPLVIPTSRNANTSPSWNIINKYDVNTLSPVFNNANPLYVEYEEPVTLNCVKCDGGLRALNQTNNSVVLPNGTMMYLDYSDDGITYTEIASAVTSADPSNSGYGGVFNMEFADTTAKYWRLRTSYQSYPIALTTNSDNRGFLTFNRKASDIVFSTPPAAGDILTMDVGMDIIMKNSNFVVDVAAQLNFNI